MDNSSFAPLLEALETLQFWLQRDGASRVMRATPAIAGFRRQELPAHVKVSVKKRRGKRVSVRGPRNSRLTRLVQAQWPEDGQWEAAVPALACVLRGQADFHIADYLVQCQPGDWLFIPAGISKPDRSLPYIMDNSDRQCDLLWIYPGPLNGMGLQCFICHSTSQRTYVGLEYGTSDVKNHFLVHLYNELNEEMQHARNDTFMQHLLIAIIMWLHREISEGRAIIPWARQMDQPVQRSPDFADEVRKHIDGQMHRHLTIDQMARLMAVSPATFTRRFRAQMG